MDINERFIKFSGKWGPIIPGLIEIGSDVRISVGGVKFEGSCTKTETLDNQDGTVDVVYVLKLVHVDL